MYFQDGQIGFGVTQEEAVSDWYINRCRDNLEYDTENKFKSKREIYKPWFPQSNMLHISTVGCLIYKEGKLWNTKSKQSIAVDTTGYNIYYYLYNIIGNNLSYSDIFVTLHKEISEFFKNISNEFVPLKQYPIIKISERGVNFNPEVIYSLNSEIFIGYDRHYIGLKFLGEDFYYIVELEDKKDTLGILCYLSYRVELQFEWRT